MVHLYAGENKKIVQKNNPRFIMAQFAFFSYKLETTFTKEKPFSTFIGRQQYA